MTTAMIAIDALSDRELLELAAKAANAAQADTVFSAPIRYDAERGQCFIINLDMSSRGYMEERLWVPLDDDGEALRLAHAVGINIQMNGWLTVGHRRLPSGITVTGLGDMKTLRRLIVQIAAAVATLPPEPPPKPISMKELQALNERVEALWPLFEAERARRERPAP